MASLEQVEQTDNVQNMDQPPQPHHSVEDKRQTTLDRPPISPISPSVPPVTRQYIPDSPRFSDSIRQSLLENRNESHVPNLGTAENELWAPEFQSLRQSTSLAFPTLHDNFMDDTDDPWGLPRALQSATKVADNAALKPLVGFLGERIDSSEDLRFVQTPPTSYQYDTLPPTTSQYDAFPPTMSRYDTFPPNTSRYDTFPPTSQAPTSQAATSQAPAFQTTAFQAPTFQAATFQAPTLQAPAPVPAAPPNRQIARRDALYGADRRQRRPARIVQADGTVGRKMRAASSWNSVKNIEQQAKAIELEQQRPNTKYPERFMCYVQGCGVSANDKSEISRHWNGSTPAFHGTAAYERWKVFGVVYQDWLRDENLFCTMNATDRDGWKRCYQSYHGNACETELLDAGMIQ